VDKDTRFLPIPLGLDERVWPDDGGHRGIADFLEEEVGYW
jgi:hypothetical protein